MDSITAIDLIKPGVAIVAGAAMLWFPGSYRQRVERRHAERLAKLDAGDEERFFEERRSLEAHRPARAWVWRLLGAILCLLGAARIYGLLA